MLTLLLVLIGTLFIFRQRILKLRSDNSHKRDAILRGLGVAGPRRIIGFFHPYW